MLYGLPSLRTQIIIIIIKKLKILLRIWFRFFFEGDFQLISSPPSTLLLFSLFDKFLYKIISQFWSHTFTAPSFRVIELSWENMEIEENLLHKISRSCILKRMSGFFEKMSDNTSSFGERLRGLVMSLNWNIFEKFSSIFQMVQFSKELSPKKFNKNQSSLQRVKFAFITERWAVLNFFRNSFLF